MRDNIVIVGFKAAGKSSLGAQLAQLMGWSFADADTLIEDIHRNKSGEYLNCREIYSKFGAEYMRALESDALKQLSYSSKTVIATGGGVVLQAENRQIIKKIGFCVFLDTALPELEKRLLSQIDSPLFKDKKIADLHAERYRLYTGVADLHFSPAHGESPEHSACRLLKLLKVSFLTGCKADI